MLPAAVDASKASVVATARDPACAALFKFAVVALAAVKELAVLSTLTLSATVPLSIARVPASAVAAGSAGDGLLL